MPDPLAARQLLRAYGIRPHKNLGQNFIVDHEALDAILLAAELHRTEHVVEVGAGLGALTRRLSVAAAHITAIELDSRLIPVLKAVLQGAGNVDIVAGDALSLDVETAPDYQVVANIPYTITSALLRHYLEAERPPDRIVLTVQSEVAERATAQPGQMSMLALSIQIYGEPEIRGRIPATAFYPKPEVESSILRIDIHPTPAIGAEWIDPVFRIARAGFTQRRKKLSNSLGTVFGKQAGEKLKDAGIDPSARAQELSLEEWEALAKVGDQG
ncbi:MAG: 16S rRNA (adenine(1518)-N(6)/adenine(1519)-N(6))-dimethyltransferase RsmA [Anaerolineales bacterium]